MVKYVYTLGASGERIKVEELDRTVEYTYDELYRLTSETITEGEDVTVYTYAYDSVSNRTLKTVNGVETVYTYNALNQLISENDTTYEYDNAGNLVRVIGTGKSALYEYNSENKLVKATVQQGNTVVVETYTYDYEGNRTSKTTTQSDGSVEFVKYLNDNSSLTNVLVEISNNGEVIYTVGADLISQEVDGEVYTYIYDGHGTVRALADEDGKITDTYSYDAFGNLLKSTGSTENSYLYCGEQYDSTTGLYYLRARYMDTSTGRFISQDTYQGSTADPISLHKYLYANSNPVTYSDPSGYFSLGEMAGAMAISGIIGGISCGVINVFRFLWDNDYDGNAINWWQAFVEGANAGIWFSFLAGGWVYMAVHCAFIALIVSALSGLSAYQLFTSAYEKYQNGNNGGAVIDYLLSLLSTWSMFYFGHSAYSQASAWAASNITTSGVKGTTVSNAQSATNKLTWNEFQHANKGKYTRTGMSDAWKAYKQSVSNNSISSSSSIHGNSLNNSQTNYGYVLCDKSTGQILKFGETLYPSSRYSQSYLNSINAEMKIIVSGTKSDVHYWQYDMNNYYYNQYGEYPPLVNSNTGW